MLRRVAFGCAAASLISFAKAQYALQDDYTSTTSSFADMFDFYTGADPTNGYVNYVDYGTAAGSGLYNDSNGQVYMGVDYTNVASGSGRSSIRVSSKNSYNNGLIILDLEHMPGGICGTWPAFWMLGPDWPTNGEIDIIEGVNSDTTNLMTLHTDAGCSITNSGSMSGTIETSNCDVNAPGQGTNEGCSIQTTNQATYGTGFNDGQGGVYATEWTSQAINIWYFPRSAIPADITAGTPDPSNWGLALSTFAGGCDIDQHMDSMQIVFDTTFCGDWAGAVWSTDATCGSLASTCNDYVQNNPSAFTDAYWLVNSLKVYQSNGAAPSGPAPTSTTTTTPFSTITYAPTTTSFQSTLTTSYIASTSSYQTPLTSTIPFTSTPYYTIPAPSASPWSSSWGGQYTPTSAWPVQGTGSWGGQPWAQGGSWQAQSANAPTQTWSSGQNSGWSGNGDQSGWNNNNNNGGNGGWGGP